MQEVHVNVCFSPFHPAHLLHNHVGLAHTVKKTLEFFKLTGHDDDGANDGADCSGLLKAICP